MLTAALLSAAVTLASCTGKSGYYAENNMAAMYDMPERTDMQGAPEFNTEEYDTITENTFMSAVSDPLSTFSIDVDTASYSNVRRMINNGQTVPRDAVRIEEFINYFSYSYPEPKADEPFSVTTEITDCPWNEDTKLMRVGLRSIDIDLSQRQPMNLVFLIDVSGSMYREDKLPLVQKAFSILTDQLTPQDRISIVTYADGDSVVLEGSDGSERQKILEAIRSLKAGGSTAGSKGIQRAYEIAEKYFIQGGNNRIILATDGDLNVGITSQSELKALVEKKREGGVFLSVLGFGTGNIKDNKMETLADNGNGVYSYIDSEREARKVLCEEMTGNFITVAKDVKIQVEFNPAYIKGYRLIGYENRVMSAEDFSDDRKDAGEIGAGHSVTALYEIADKDSKMTFASSELKYSDTPQGKENGELLTVSVRCKKPDGDESRLYTYPVTGQAYSPAMSEDMSFAAAVAEFGMLLRESNYKGNSTRDSILSLVSDCNIADDEYKTEFVQLVKAAKLP
jgi:Ca-activated chloride channel family protein